jgi:DNA-binding protein HU-beta
LKKGTVSGLFFVIRAWDEPQAGGQWNCRPRCSLLDSHWNRLMNTSELADHLAASDAGLTKSQAKTIVDTLFAGVRDALVAGDEVNLAGFGKFKVQDKPARTGRNPATGETLQIAASKKVSFTVAKALKDAVAK